MFNLIATIIVLIINIFLLGKTMYDYLQGKENGLVSLIFGSFYLIFATAFCYVISVMIDKL